MTGNFWRGWEAEGLEQGLLPCKQEGTSLVVPLPTRYRDEEMGGGV